MLGAERVWAFHAFGARVAAFRVCQGPLLLLADHRPPPSCMPVLAVADLNATVEELRARGRRSEGEAFEIPNGPCYRFADPSGNRAGDGPGPDPVDADGDSPNALPESIRPSEA